jgi:hypothetical protein
VKTRAAAPANNFPPRKEKKEKKKKKKICLSQQPGERRLSRFFAKILPEA